MTLESVVERFNAKRSGKEWKAKCPAHDDHTPSLSITEGRNGCILIKCRAGCTLDEILAAVGLHSRDLFRAAPTPQHSSTATQGRTAKKIAAKFDWSKCVEAFTDKHLQHIAKWRGWQPEFVRELRDKKLIGIYDGLFAFPVENDGKIVGAHVRMKNRDWFYTPSGIHAAPFVFGEFGERPMCFESTWDGLTYIEKSGEWDGVIITRGNANWKFATNLAPENCTLMLWTQNDDPGATWELNIVENAKCAVKRVKIPADFKDLNQWTQKSSATADDLIDAITSAETARKAEKLPAEISFEDFYAYMPMHNYIFIPAREFWPASSVNSRLPKIGSHNASSWIDKNRPVEQMTWAPGLPMLIENRLISDGGWIDRHGCRTFNLYRPPNIALGDAQKAGKWIKHVRRLYPKDAKHIIRWLAHQVQRPHEKINHALFLGGNQGIGKDTILYPVKAAVGQWNVQEILPPMLLGRFNGFVKAVLLCINEVHDLGDLNRYALYERLKAYTAAPPDVIRVDEKNLREYAVLNVCGVVLTSNHKTNGLYLPEDDRRHYVAWSNADKDKFNKKYWQDIYAWYDREGSSHVAAYLAQLDISDFNPKWPPPKTDAFWQIVESNRAPENAELADALDQLQNPEVVTKEQVVTVVSGQFADWLRDRRNARQIPYRFEEVGYIAVRNLYDKSDGRWKVDDKRCVIYAKRTLSIRDQITAARKFIEERRP
jgi:hypothetical protein